MIDLIIILFFTCRQIFCLFYPERYAFDTLMALSYWVLIVASAALRKLRKKIDRAGIAVCRCGLLL